VAYLVGTDEAGYGPNLGPLIISATVWQVPDDAVDEDLYQRLRSVVSAQPSSSARPRRVTIADSKALYSPATGLELLERGLLAAVGLWGHSPRCWRALWQLLCPGAQPTIETEPWYAGYDAPLPHVAEPDGLERLTLRLRAGCEQAAVRLLGIRSRAVFPDEWNQAIDRYGNKASALSNLTLELLCQALGGLDDEPVLIFCDKHGGRNSYHMLLQQHVVDWLIEVLLESGQSSIYRWGPSERRVRAEFCPGAERFLPVALASMASKYLRELAMRPFNEFWSRHVPQLKPTAGYPLDARRFKADISAVQTSLGIADRVLWRVR
jgi:hypothetical protein